MSEPQSSPLSAPAWRREGNLLSAGGDAEAIAEAATRPTMRFVELKSAEQLDIQVLPRARDRLVAHRTALINQLHAY